MPDRWETLDSSLAYSCEGFDIVTERVELPDGTETEFDYLSEQESVVVVPFTPDGEVVVVDEWRHAVGRLNRGLPAGTREGEEPIPGAVHRELREETGYESGEIEHLTSLEPANGFSDAVFHYYVARKCRPTATQDLDTDETIEVATTSFENLVGDVREGDVADGRTALGILYYALFEAT